MIPTFEFLRAQAVTLPLLAKFAIAMAVIVGIPPLARRAHFPVVVGLLLTGVVSGRMASMSLDRTGRLRSSLQNWERCC